MKIKASRQYFTAGLLVSIFFLGGIGLFSHLAWSSLLDAFQWVSHTREVEQQIGRLLSHLADAETGERGYLLTQRDSYLEPYNATLPVIPADLSQLHRLTADNPVQQAHITNLSRIVDAEMEATAMEVSLQKQGFHDQALAMVATGQAKEIMDNIRRTI